MISALLLKEKHNIGVNSYGKITLDKENGVKLAVTEVPAVRYQFTTPEGDSEAKGEWVKDTIEYLEKMMKKFSKSVHIWEVELKNDWQTEVWRQIVEKEMGVAIILKLDITDDVMKEMKLQQTTMGALLQIQNDGLRLDRVMMRDKTSCMNTVTARELKMTIGGLLKIPAKQVDKTIGVCGSPLTCQSECCLSAEFCRKLEAQYGEASDMVVPSANYECRNQENGDLFCCCIMHTLIDRDIAVDEPVKGFQKKESTSENKKPKKEKTDGSEKESKKAEPKKKKPNCKVFSSWV